jgi:uncharacterized protein (UPF0332 family)
MNAELIGIMEKARRKLRAAHILLDSGSWSDAGSRAYYAAFHAISAALLSVGESYSSHAQVIGMFNRRFVHTGQFPREFTSMLTRLFEDRQSGDYDVTVELNEAEAREDVVDAEKIVNAIIQTLVK